MPSDDNAPDDNAPDDNAPYDNGPKDNGPEDHGPWNNRQTRARPEGDAILRKGRDLLNGILPDGVPPVTR